MKKINNKFPILLMCISVGLLIVNSLLVYQNINLQSQISSSKPKVIDENTVLDEFEAKDLAGNQTKVSYSGNGKKNVLLYFKTSCGFCHKQMPYWKELTSDVDKKYKVTAITTDTNVEAINEYLKKYEVENWEVLIIDNDQAQKAKLLGTPITIVANESGKVEKAWIGFWQDKTKLSINDYFLTNI